MKAVLPLGLSWIWKGHSKVHVVVRRPACFEAQLCVGSVFWWGDLQKLIQCCMYLQTEFSRLAFCEHFCKGWWNCKTHSQNIDPAALFLTTRNEVGKQYCRNPQNLEIWPCRSSSVALQWLTELTVPPEEACDGPVAAQTEVPGTLTLVRLFSITEEMSGFSGIGKAIAGKTSVSESRRLPKSITLLCLSVCHVTVVFLCI